MSRAKGTEPAPRPQNAPSRLDTARGRGITLLHHLHATEGVYAAHRIAHLEARLEQREGVVSTLADEVERLRQVIVRAARLCEGRDTAMVLQVLREGVAMRQEEGDS